MTSGYINSHGTNLYYETIGEGDPILLVNGGPGYSHEYMQELKALAPYGQLIFYDQRGTGLSDKADPSTYTIDTNVEDLENLRRALNLENVRLLGHSWGGMLVQSYILKYPAHISKVIIANAISSCDDLNTSLARMLAAVPPETRAIIERVEHEGIYAHGDSYTPEYRAAHDIAYEPVRLNIPAPDYLQDSLANIAYDVYKTMWGDQSEFCVTGTLIEFNVYPRLHEIRVPTLVIVGASDMPSIEMAQATTDAIPNARLEIFYDSRHFPFLEEPEKFVRVVGDFLNEK